jgi:hypothetical protein
MTSLLNDLLSAGYLASGFCIAAVYVPRVRKMLRDDAATALSHSLPAELLWTLCRVVAFAYVAAVAAQPLIALSVGLDLAGRAVVLAVIARARARRQQGMRVA